MGAMNVMEMGEEAMLLLPLHWVSVLPEADLFSVLVPGPLQLHLEPGPLARLT